MEFLKGNFLLKDNIYICEVRDKITKKTAIFYKDKPFPGYKIDDSKATLLKKGDNNYLASKFKNFVGYNKNILEIGCGTGQLSIYFSIGNNNRVVALDAAHDSLILAANFIKKNNIKNINLINADIFEDNLKENYFDFIWTNGVLHHTKNPKKAFELSLKLLKTEGYILIGLYNRYGRIRTILRKYYSKLFGKKILKFLDPTIKNLKENEPELIDSWIKDHYEHPVESLHTIDEVLNWFDMNNVEFISSIPKCSFNIDNDFDLFKKQDRGNIFSRIVNQIMTIFNYIGDDGGLFIMIGRKNE